MEEGDRNINEVIIIFRYHFAVVFFSTFSCNIGLLSIPSYLVGHQVVICIKLSDVIFKVHLTSMVYW